MAAKTPAQKRADKTLARNKNEAYRFCKQLAGLADLPTTAVGFEELRRMINEGEGYLKWVTMWEPATAETVIKMIVEASESP